MTSSADLVISDEEKKRFMHMMEEVQYFTTQCWDQMGFVKRTVLSLWLAKATDRVANSPSAMTPHEWATFLVHHLSNEPLPLDLNSHVCRFLEAHINNECRSKPSTNRRHQSLSPPSDRHITPSQADYDIIKSIQLRRRSHKRRRLHDRTTTRS